MNPTLGEELKRYRELRGFTQMQVCKQVKISQTALSQIETSVHWPSRNHLRKLLKLYELELHIKSIKIERLKL